MRMMIWMLFLILLLGGCGKRYVAKVTQVRILVENEHKQTKGNNGVDGALIGGLVAGSVGAVVGYAATHEGREYRVLSQLKGCRFFAQLQDGTTVNFYFSEYSALIERCALLQEGDDVILVFWGESASSAEWRGGQS